MSHPTTSTNKIARAVDTILDRRKWNRSTLASEMNLVPSTLSHNLRDGNKLSLHTLVKIARALECDLTLTLSCPPIEPINVSLT